MAYVYLSSAAVITPSAILVCSCTPRNISVSGSEVRNASSLAASRAHSGRILVSALPLASLGGASSWVTVATAGALDGIAEGQRSVVVLSMCNLVSQVDIKWWMRLESE